MTIHKDKEYITHIEEKMDCVSLRESTVGVGEDRNRS
jgi:hypothetical protein